MRLCFALILLWPAISSAQEVTIRSGDHAEFARLVLAIPDGADWSLGRATDGYALRVAGIDGFDPRGVFDRIDRSRIASLSPSGTTLALRLACDCHADAFLWRPDRLVVDVIDGPPPPDSPFEAALEPVAKPRPRPVLPTVFDTVTREFDPQPDLPEDPERTVELETTLLESLARAASQGVVDLTLPGEAIPLDGLQAGQVPGLQIQTSIDRDAGGLTPEPVRPAAQTCPDPSDWDMTVWAGESFQRTIAARRSALTGEFDAWTPGAVEDLARGFIAHGFGAEARQALALDGAGTHQRLILQDMALLVDGDDPEPGSPLTRLGQCAAPVALWSVLAADAGTPAADPGAILRSFKALPPPLRRAVGPRLARRFSEGGTPALAEGVLTDLGPGPGLGQVELDLSRGDRDAALDRLHDLARTDPRFGPRDLARLIDLSLAEGREIAPDLRSLAEALQSEHAGTEAALVLAAARFRADLAAGRFESAGALLDRPPLSGAPERDEMAGSLVRAVTDRGGDLAFLDHVLGGPLPELAPGTENAVADRLIAMGFAARAQRLISGRATGEAAAERRYLRAEIALALDETDRVEDLLAALTDDRARDIRARARAADGDHAGALAALGDPDPGTAWRAGAWVTLETTEDALLSAAARTMQQPGPDPLAEDSLAARRALLEEAAQSRAEIDALLDRFAPPDLSGG